MSRRSGPIALLLAVAIASTDARAEPRPASVPPAPVSAVMELSSLMTPAEFHEAGLDKLTAAERAVLDGWVGRLLVRTLTARRRAGCSPPVDSRVRGDFEGWDGEAVFRLENGQVWRQRSAASRYVYRFSPRVVIRASDGACVLQVDGIDEEVPVERLW